MARDPAFPCLDPPIELFQLIVSAGQPWHVIAVIQTIAQPTEDGDEVGERWLQPGGDLARFNRARQLSQDALHPLSHHVAGFRGFGWLQESSDVQQLGMGLLQLSCSCCTALLRSADQGAEPG